MSEGLWHSLKETIWEDNQNVLGDNFICLEKHYSDLKSFFIDILGVKEKADPESFSQRWLNIQSQPIDNPKELRLVMDTIYRMILPIAKQEESERPSWWDGFINDALILTQNNLFKASSVVIVPDDGELKKIFSNTGMNFVWRPEKDSFSQWAPLYDAFSISRISESVTNELLEDAVYNIKASNDFISESAILMIASYLREKDGDYFDGLLKDGVFNELVKLQEVTTGKEIKMLFKFKNNSFTEEIEENYPIFWDRNNALLILSEQKINDNLKAKVASEIAKGVMNNRAYTDLANWIELVLGAKNTTRIQNKGWSVPRDISKFFKEENQDTAEASKNKNKGNVKEKGNDRDNKNKSPVEHLLTKFDSTVIKTNTEKTSPSAVLRENNDEFPNKTKKIENHKDVEGDKNSDDEPRQSVDLLDKFTSAFNKGGKSTLSEKFKDKGPYNVGSVRNPTRRRKTSFGAHVDRINNEPASNERRRETERTILESADPATRAYLLNMYYGECQICGTTFPQRDGNPFFVVGHIIERRHARLVDDPANALCLCPLHFAQWRHGVVEAKNIQEQILSKKTEAEGGIDEIALTINLCGKECQINYAEKHLVDLQTLLIALAEKNLK